MVINHDHLPEYTAHGKWLNLHAVHVTDRLISGWTITVHENRMIDTRDFSFIQRKRAIYVNEILFGLITANSHTNLHDDLFNIDF